MPVASRDLRKCQKRHIFRHPVHRSSAHDRQMVVRFPPFQRTIYARRRSRIRNLKIYFSFLTVNLLVDFSNHIKIPGRDCPSRGVWIRMVVHILILKGSCFDIGFEGKNLHRNRREPGHRARMRGGAGECRLPRGGELPRARGGSGRSLPPDRSSGRGGASRASGRIGWSRSPPPRG